MPVISLSRRRDTQSFTAKEISFDLIPLLKVRCASSELDIVPTKSCSTGVHIFHSRTERVDGELRTAGGRVFSVAATGKSLEEAVSAAYKGVECIHFDGMFYRKDIAAG